MILSRWILNRSFMTTHIEQSLSHLTANGVARDWIDLRDMFYDPSLSTLGSDLSLADELFERFERSGQSLARPIFGVRDQGETGQCVGHALAALVDIQRRLQRADWAQSRDTDRSSAQMLYHMARFHDQFTLMNGQNGGGRERASQAVSMEPSVEGVRSLRSAIKALYHHGVYIEDGDHDALKWENQTLPSVAQAKSARNTGLGAYYRLRPVLNHYHAALKDTGSVIVSARLHSGWAPANVALQDGQIDWRGEIGEGGLHAFAIIGYTREGFLVLNSWGENWGGYQGTCGVALWRYQDWARNVVDGWVLRLGVPAPGAFDVSIGEQGLANAYGDIRAGSTPCLELMGHYIHLDDGHFVEYSPYPSNQEMIDKTLRLLPQAVRQGVRGDTLVGAAANADVGIAPCKGVMIWVTGALEGMGTAFEQAVRRKKMAAALDCYPFFVFWCNDFVESSVGFLRRAFEETEVQTGPQAAHRDQLIENSVRGTGRAFWREVESCARRAIWGNVDPSSNAPLRGDTPDGRLGLLMHKIYTELKDTDCEIHLVAEGAGVIVLDEMIRMFARLDDEMETELARKITTINLSLPAIKTNLGQNGLTGAEPPREHALTLVNYINYCRTKGLEGALPDKWVLPAQIHIPSQALERKMCNGAYHKSILHLIANAFEDRPPLHQLALSDQTVTMLGMSGLNQAWARAHPSSAPALNPFVELDSIEKKTGLSGLIEQKYVSSDMGLENRIFEAIEFHANLKRNAH